MENFERTRQKDIHNVISIVKLSALLLCSITIYNSFLVTNKILINNNGEFINITAITILVSLIMISYSIWVFFNKKIFDFKYAKKFQIAENFMFVAIFTFLIFLSKSYISEYKFFFIFIIITSTIQLGMKQGMIISIVSSAIILIMDLVCAPKTEINMYFQNDLILVGVFILTAWTLGYYVKIEEENINKKNQQLKKLNEELSEKDNQRKYIDEMLLKNEACYNLLIENSLDAIFVHRKGKLIFTNESAMKLLGVSSQLDLSGKSILEFTPKDDRDSLFEKFKHVYKEKTTMFTFEEKIIKNTGEEIYVENTSAYFIYEGKPTILTIRHDITSEKQVEKLEKDVKKNIKLLNETREFNKFIIELFSNISHELKTPLNVIFSAIQLLNIYKNSAEEDAKNKRDKYLKVMKQNCYRLMRLINNLLDVTKLESGFLKLHMKNYNIISVIEEITLSVAPYIESKGIDLTFDTDIEEKIMCVDPDKIERIILNLLSNAIKFTDEEGKIYVNITDKEDSISISVKDTGLGIPEDKLDLIFERFGQVDKTFRRDCEGTGIGLCLVKSFAELHGGKVTVTSKLGEGSEFIVELPVKKIREEELEGNPIYQTNIERINIEFSDIYFEGALL